MNEFHGPLSQMNERASAEREKRNRPSSAPPQRSKEQPPERFSSRVGSQLLVVSLLHYTSWCASTITREAAAAQLPRSSLAATRTQHTRLFSGVLLINGGRSFVTLSVHNF